MAGSNRRSKARRSHSSARRESPAAPKEIAPAFDIAGRFRDWAEGMLNVVGPVASLTRTLAEARERTREKPTALRKAGELLRTMREAVGISAKEAGLAAKLRDPGLVEQAEGGQAALPFEAILRLAGVLGKKDPMGFATKLMRAYQPEAWKTFDQMRIGGLMMPDARERAILDIYRQNKAARHLSDDDFSAVVEFTKTVFDMLVDFRAEPAAE